MIILFGKPGAGKGSQAKRLIKNGGYVLVGAGELLRQEAAHNKALAEKMNAGELVDSKILLDLVSLKLSDHHHEKIILDGFPRDQDQAVWLKDHLRKNPPEKVDVIVLEIPDSEVYRRLALRARADDNDRAIAARLEIYRQSVSQAIDLLGQAARVSYVDGIGSKDAVHERLLSVLERNKI